MEYKVRETEAGRFEAIIKNPSFGYESVYVFTTENGAREFINSKKMESNQALAGIVTISDYFGKAGK